MNLATIPDLSTLLIDATVEEIDRGRMRVGDEVIVRIDALPDVSIPATLTAIAPLAEMSLDSRGRGFHVYAALGPAQRPARPAGNERDPRRGHRRIPAATIIPTKALFTRQGKPTVYQSRQMASDRRRRDSRAQLRRSRDQGRRRRCARRVGRSVRGWRRRQGGSRAGLRRAGMPPPGSANDSAYRC